MAVASFTIGEMQTGQATAPCPGGTRVVGGGVTGTAATDSQVEVSGPNVDESWTARVQNNGPGQNTYVATALCSAATDRIVRQDIITVGAGDVKDGQAYCPAGTRLIGGGITGTTTAGSLLQVSGPLDQSGLTSNLSNGDVGRSWYAKVQTGLDGNTFVVSAICSQDSDATLRVDPFTIAANPGVEDGQAVCSSGTRVVGGGVTSTGTTSEYVRVSGPLDQTGLTSNLANGDLGRSWYASEKNLSGGSNTYVSTAICAPPTSTTSGAKGGAAQFCKGKPVTISAVPGGGRTEGSSKGDVIAGSPGRDKIDAGAGDDLVCAGGGKDTVKGGAGKDSLYGQGGKDKLLGQGGKDLLSGGGKRDTCVGGPGRDAEKSC
jgi:Ca2+-binding RTX toxin-like protein